MPAIDEDPIQKITSKVTEYLTKSYSAELQNEIREYSSELQTLAKWYQKAGLERDDVISSIVQDVVSNLFSNFPQKFVQASIKNIQIQSQNKQPKLKFDISVELDPIKPYVEFEISVKGGLVYSERFTFEINSKCIFKDIHIELQESQRKVCLGRLEGILIVKIVTIPFVKLETPKEISSATISLDLSEFCIS